MKRSGVSEKADSLAPAGRGGAAVRGPLGIGSPPNGNTGGNVAGQVRYQRRTITPHWLRVTHPESERQRIRAMLVKRFGEPDQVRGRWFFEFGERFPNGALLMWGTIVGQNPDEIDSEGVCCVDLSGSVLDDLDAMDRIALCVELTLGGKVTRLDLAVDAHHEDGVGLIDLAAGSLQAGECCGSKTWEPKIKYKSGEVTAYGVNIGARGKAGSGRYIRIYDKGLESGEAERGKWERFEVEFTKDCAAEAAADVFGCPNDWERRAWARVNGAVDFREVNSGADRHKDRRGRVAWWSAWIAGSTPVATVPKRVETTLERHTRWLTQTVLPTTARLAESVGVTFCDALYHLCGPSVEPRKCDKFMRAMLGEWRRILHERPVIACTA